ncbi:hypothetical protein KRR55_01265 [Paeniglutamicibacter sp. ABSL32-1]|uniref:hypothetical protein n=1 Tax=Paeniglutamicibacter quisquiliarum TaxID=2849498 RepID=UPI001C2D4705|nr:hypothetical protein [Paeniglutamicibacter quisquiliarum]MBV1777735.1 hypothetical protein [Paeniglutamicibacter quisquiliarum]
MNETYSLVKPDAKEWSDLPLCPPARRQTVVAWLIVLVTTVASFIADRGWEDLPPEYWQGTYQALDMYGLSATFVALIVSFTGWLFGRLAVAMAPIVLLYAAIPYSLDTSESATFWWAGTIAAATWWLIQARFTLRQIHAVRTLASVSNTGTTIELGSGAIEALRRFKRRSLSWATGLSALAIVGWLAAMMAMPAAVGRTYQELEDLALPDCLGTAAATVSILALVQWHRCGWRFLARRRIGTVVWHVPIVAGPVQGLWASLSEDAGTVPFNRASSVPSCSCIEESLRANPDEADLYGDIGVLASAYCPVHGIDRINSLSVEQFRSEATNTWLWDEESLLPMSTQAESDRTLLIGYAGNAFTGLPARFTNGMAEIYPGADDLVEERESHTNESEWERPLRPLGGVLDRIDLAPAGLGGHAVRYLHGRAWFDTTDEA